MSITHQFQSARSDNGDAGAVQPSHWDAPHLLTGLLGLFDVLAPTPNVVVALDGSGTAVLTPTAQFAPTYSPVFTGVPLAPTPDPAVNSNQIATMAALQTAIANLVATAPTTLNTLNEIAAALGNDPNFSATITASLGNRLRVDAAQGLSTGQKAQGLSNLGITIGTAANNIVALDGSAKLPAVDGSQLTGMASATITSQSDAQAGTENTHTMTALRVAQAIGVRAPHGHLWGLTLSNDGTSPNTVLDIAAGDAASQNALLMSAVAFTKNCNAAWTVGSGNGALDSGSTLAASTWYHVWQIMRTDTWVVDYLLSTSATAPAMPSGYTEKRRIGSIKTDGSSHIIAFSQVGDWFYWAASKQDMTTPLTNNTDTLITLSVPTGIRSVPFFRVFVETGTNGDVTGLRWCTPDLGPHDAVLNSTMEHAQIGSYGNAATTTRFAGAQDSQMTNLSAQLSFYINFSSDTLTAFGIDTYGWQDFRGKSF